MNPVPVIPVHIIPQFQLQFIQILKSFIPYEFRFMILNAASTTALSYGQPLWLNERSIPKVSSISSIRWFLNSFPLSMWNRRISSRAPSTLWNACFISSAVLCSPVLYPMISLLKRSTSTHM